MTTAFVVNYGPSTLQSHSIAQNAIFRLQKYFHSRRILTFQHPESWVATFIEHACTFDKTVVFPLPPGRTVARQTCVTSTVYESAIMATRQLQVHNGPHTVNASRRADELTRHTQLYKSFGHRAAINIVSDNGRAESATGRSVGPHVGS